MIFIFPTFLIAFLGAAVADEVKKDGHVHVLTADTFDKFITEKQFVLVEFYAPWCGHCKSLEPQYEEAAKTLAKNDNSIHLAKVDSIEQKELAERFGVKGYPTLKLFKDADLSKTIDYSGERTSEKIVAWLKKKKDSSVLEIKTADDVTSVKKDHRSHICGCFPDKEHNHAKIFANVADIVDDQVFTMVTDEQLCKEFDAEVASIVFHKQDETPTKFNLKEFDEADLKKWILVHSLDEIVDFSHKTAPKIFGGEITSHLLLFFSQKDGHFEKYLKELKLVAKDHRGKVMFVTVNTDETDHERILEFFGMKKEEVPSYRLISMEADMTKYKPSTSEISAKSVQEFVQSYLEGKLKPHLLSQELPDDWSKKPVKVLVATNFDDVVFDSSKKVLVEFYAPWCGHCKQLEPIYNQLGEHFGKDQDVVIAKIDATANELEHTKITSFPTIKLYTKDNQAHDYNGERNLDALVKFVETDGEAGGPPTTVDEEEEKEEEPAARDEL